MLDDSNNFIGTAAKELEEEVLGIFKFVFFFLPIISGEGESIDLVPLTPHAIALSPGGSDEQMQLFLYKKEITAEKLEQFQSKLTGNLKEGEQITLRVCPLEELRTVPDMKTQYALSLYLSIE